MFKQMWSLYIGLKVYMFLSLRLQIDRFGWGSDGLLCLQISPPTRLHFCIGVCLCHSQSFFFFFRIWEKSFIFFHFLDSHPKVQSRWALFFYCCVTLHIMLCNKNEGKIWHTGLQRILEHYDDASSLGGLQIMIYVLTLLILFNALAPWVKPYTHWPAILMKPHGLLQLHQEMQGPMCRPKSAVTAPACFNSWFSLNKSQFHEKFVLLSQHLVCSSAT